MNAALARAFASVRRRRSAAILGAIAFTLCGLLAGAAAHTVGSLRSGLGRAQERAGTPQLVARFAPADERAIEQRVRALANVAAYELRLVARPVDVSGRGRRGTVELNGIQGRPIGLRVVAGRLPRGYGEVAIERGFADAWGIGTGDRLWLHGRRGGEDVVVGVTVEPDAVAFPLASRPRVYVAIEEARFLLPEGDEVSELRIRARDPARVPELLVQARLASFGLRDVTTTTREGARAAVGAAAGVAIVLLTALGVVALAAAACVIALSAHARVARERRSLAVLRALGLGRLGVAASYGAEAAIVALPCVLVGAVAGAAVVAGPLRALLHDLNMEPASIASPTFVGAVGATVAVAAIAAALPAWQASRGTVRSVFATSTPAVAGRLPVPSHLVLLGMRIAVGRPWRLLAVAAAIGVALATVLLLLSLARFLLRAQADPTILGERYGLVAIGAPDALARARATPGVAAAGERFEVAAASVFDPAQPLAVVAFGDGRDGVFRGRPLLSGRRLTGAGETEIGRGLADALGLALGAELRVQLATGGERRLAVVGIVQELSRDGRVAYVDASELRGVADPAIAIRSGADVDPALVARRLAERGLEVRRNAGLATDAGSFAAVVAALMRAVAFVDALACVGLVLITLVVVARERQATIAAIRAGGGGRRAVTATLTGVVLPIVIGAVLVAWLAEATVLAPIVDRVGARYGGFGLAAAPVDVAVVALATLLAATVGAHLVATRMCRRPVRALLVGA